MEREMATHSSILAWRTPWMEEPGRLQSTGLRRVWHDWATSLSLSLFISQGPQSSSPAMVPYTWWSQNHTVQDKPHRTCTHRMEASDKHSASSCWYRHGNRHPEALLETPLSLLSPIGCELTYSNFSPWLNWRCPDLKVTHRINSIIQQSFIIYQAHSSRCLEYQFEQIGQA